MQNFFQRATFQSTLSNSHQNIETSLQSTNYDSNDHPCQHFKKVEFSQAEKPNSDKNETNQEVTVLSINSAKSEGTSKGGLSK